MKISDLLTALWLALRGRVGDGQDFIIVFTELGGILWLFLLFKVFIREGLQVAEGHHSEVVKIVVKYLFVAAMFFVWPKAADSIFAAIKQLAATFYPNLDRLLTQMAGSMGFLEAGQQATANSQGLVSSVLGTVYNFTLGGILTIVGIAALFLCYALVLINIAGSLTILAMNLVLGPVFFALAFDRDFRPHAQHWFGAVLSYFMLIPLYGAALTVAATVAGGAIKVNLVGFPSGAQIFAQLIGPFMAVGVVFSANKIVNALVGGAAGSGLGSMSLGAATVLASVFPGSAVIRSTVAAGQAAAAAGSNTTRVIGSKLSSTARAALGKEGE